MLKENARRIAFISRLADNAVVLLCFVLAYYGRSSVVYWDRVLGLNLPFTGLALAPLRDYLVVLLVALPVFNLLLAWGGGYDPLRMSSSWRVLRLALIGAVGAFFAIAAVLYSLKIDISRLYLGLFCLFTGLALAGNRVVMRALMRYWHVRSRKVRNVLICGTGEQARKLAEQIESNPELGIRLVGFGCLNGQPAQASPQWLSARRLLFGVHEIDVALGALAVDEVIFTEVVHCLPQVEELVILCSEQGVRSTIAADLFSVGIVKSEVSYFGDMPLIHYRTPPGGGFELGIKRLVDIVGAFCLLLLLAPLFALCAVGIVLTSPGTILFKQRRVGLNGRLFNMYKFRSMHMGAYQELEKLKALNEMDGPVFKMKDDPRVFPFGKFMRKFSLDELPQLWNVLRGDMSLVGPRPPIPDEVTYYTRRYRRRLSMRPGLTCIWQVSGRSQIKDFDTWVKLDLEYIDNWSLLRDFAIMLRTIPAVLFGAGAR